MCPRRRRADEAALASLINQIGGELESGAARVILQQLLDILNDASNAQEAESAGESTVDKDAMLPTHAVQVLVQCGYTRSVAGGLKVSGNLKPQVARCACKLLREALSEHEQELPYVPSSKYCDKTNGKHQDHTIPAKELPQEDTNNQNTNALSNETDAPCRQNASPEETIMCTHKETVARTTSEAQQACPNPVADTNLLDGRAESVDASLIECEVDFSNHALTEPLAVLSLRTQCTARGEKYTDLQFPAETNSLYLSQLEADSWECLACHTFTKFPPLPPLAKSDEEQRRYESEFVANVRCSGCGSPSSHLAMIKYFTRPTQWLRPGERCDRCEAHWGTLQVGQEILPRMCTHFIRDKASQCVTGRPWKLIAAEPRPEDVCQGGLGNCWFAAALSIVAQVPSLVHRIIVTRKINLEGLYYVRLCHAGEWRGVVVDDQFPTSQISKGSQIGEDMITVSRGGTLCYLQGADQQLWVPLVEKAAAKLYGCYQSLKGGTFGEALALFTGFPTERIVLSPRLGKQHERHGNCDNTDEHDIWTKLLSCKHAGYLLGMGCSEQEIEKTKDEIVEAGLQANHAYGILDVREIQVNGETERLMMIRNPQGKNAPLTWNGDWGPNSAKWTPNLKFELGVNNKEGLDIHDPKSVFWMKFGDVKQYFAAIEVCRLHNGWHETRKRAQVPNGIGPGEAFDVFVPQRTKVDIVLWQERQIAQGTARGKRHANVDVGLAILCCTDLHSVGHANYELVRYFPRQCGDVVGGELALESGCHYRILPICLGLMHESAPRCVMMSLQSELAINVEASPSSWRELAFSILESSVKFGNPTEEQDAEINQWVFHEPGGCNLVIENNSEQPINVRVDASRSLNCVSSRGIFSADIVTPARSRQVLISLALSQKAPRACLSIQTELLPHGVAQAVHEEEMGGMHLPFELCRRDQQPGVKHCREHNSAHVSSEQQDLGIVNSPQPLRSSPEVANSLRFSTDNMRFADTAQDDFSIEGFASGHHTAVVIWLHGIAGCGREWDDQLNCGIRQSMPWTWWVLPEGHLRAITSHYGVEMQSWFDQVSIPIVADAKHEGLDESVSRVHNLLSRAAERGIPPHRIVLGGFSQGAVVALLAGLSYQHRIAGICAVSGWMPSHWPNLAGQLDTPILMCHGDKDAMVPFDLSWKSAQDLEGCGYSCIRFTEYNGLGHQFVTDEWEDIVAFLMDVIPESKEPSAPPHGGHQMNQSSQ